MSLTRSICNVCNSDETKIKFVKTGIKIWICKKCSFIFVHPPPSIKTQKEYYDQSHKSGLYKIHSDDDVPIRIKLNKKRYEELISYKPNGNILDVGCASGFFLDVAAKNGLFTYGIELSSDGANKCKKNHKNTFNGTLEEARYQNSFFNFVTIYDIIEHVLDPNSTIKEVSRIIKPDGFIVITTPDITSWHAKLLGKRWGMITPFEHLFYFSPNTIRILLEKHGFLIREIRKNYKVFTIDYLFKMSEYYFPNIFKALHIIRKLIPKGILMKERLFYFGEMHVVAQKINR